MPGKHCAAKKCKSNDLLSRQKGEYISFFRIPKEKNIREKWVKICRQHKGFDPDKKSLCSRHFLPDDFEDAIKARLTSKPPRRLKKDAIPKESKKIKQNCTYARPVRAVYAFKSEPSEQSRGDHAGSSCGYNDSKEFQSQEGRIGYFNFKMPTQWGIIAAGKISNDFAAAVSSLSEEEHTIIGVAARNIENAEEFANKYNIPYFYGSYENLLSNSDIDVVYIGVLHPYHFEVAKLSLEHGKNVLCEKPLCMNEKETRKLVELARRKNLFLMEAVWSRCFPVYEHLKTLLANKAVGEVLHMDVQFGAKIDVDRMWKKELGGGTVLDLGIYTLQMATLVFGNKPSTVVAGGHLNTQGVDQDMAAILTYPSGATAVLSTHSRVTLPNSAVIVGTKGTIQIQAPFWAPTKITLSGECFKEEKEFPLPQSKESFNFVNSVGLSYEAIEVRRCLIAGLLESPLITHEDSIHLARLEDEIRRQLGVHYPQDDD